MKNYIKNYISDSYSIKEKILNQESFIELIAQAASIIKLAYDSQKKVLIAGNGGSAADAQHLATELVSKFMKDRPALNAIALTTNTSVLTAIANDYDFEDIFARQIQAYGNQGDVFIAISTSGNSKNVIKAIQEAKNRGLKIIGLTGSKPCAMDNLCDLTIKVPSENTPIIQEAHIMIGHIICALVENEIEG